MLTARTVRSAVEPRRRTLLALVVYSVSTLCCRGEDASLEYAVKATYLSKFAPFVTWPPATAAKPTFDLCLSGVDEVTRLAPDAAQGLRVNGKAVAVRKLADTDSADTCQVLYVANSPVAARVLASVKGKPVLTVTDSTLPDHGIVTFAVIEHHVRFDIDDALAASGGLAISSKLLSLAHAVTPAGAAAR